VSLLADGRLDLSASASIFINLSFAVAVGGPLRADESCINAGHEGKAMANIFLNVEKGIEVAAEDALKWLTGTVKALHAAPAAIAALATLAGALEKPLSELAGAVENPLNIALDVETAEDLKAAWPEVKAFLVTLGVKF
jgi:hypothetical protein